MADRSLRTVRKIGASIDDGFGLAAVDSTEDHLELTLARRDRQRIFRLDRHEVRTLLETDLLDRLSASAQPGLRAGQLRA